MMRLFSAAVLAFLLATPAYAETQWFVGARGTLPGNAGSFALQACSSYNDWARFESLRYLQYDAEAAVKFIDQHCPTTLTGRVIVEQIARAPNGIQLIGLCLRPMGSPAGCLWLDSSWVKPD